MDRSKKMSETEAEIMEVLWSSEEPMSASELIDYFSVHHGKVWKSSTLATFLSRLSQKGLVDSTRRGRVPYYYPIQTRAAYMQSIAQEMLDTMYQGSVTKFFAALCGDTPLSDKDREELRAWLDKEA